MYAHAKNSFAFKHFYSLSCGGGSFDQNSEHNDIERVDSLPDKTIGGLSITIKNSLAQHRPKLKFEVCSANTATTEDKKDFCYASDVAVNYKDSAYFTINKGKLDELLKNSDENAIMFRFKDSYSNSLVYWHCYDNVKTKIRTDTTVTQFLRVQVTQINSLSYSCRIE